MNKVNPFSALAARFLLIFLSNLFDAFKDILFTNPTLVWKSQATINKSKGRKKIFSNPHLTNPIAVASCLM